MNICGLLPKALSFVFLLTASAAVFDDAVTWHWHHDDAEKLIKQTYIVTFVDSDVSPTERCEALADSMGGFVEYVYDQVFNGCSLTFLAAQAKVEETFMALSINTAVMAVEEDQIVHASEIPANDHGFGRDSASSSPQSLQASAAAAVSSWGLDRIDQCALPLDGLTTKQDATGVRVFILDTGIRSDHVEFANGVISTEDCHYSAIRGETAMTDRNGHGTHVAGTTCGAQYGVANNCQLCVVKVLDAKAFGAWSGIIAGLDHVASKCSVLGSPLCVANMSLGGSYSSAVNKAVAAAVRMGVVIVVSAGNESSDACKKSPASEPLAITVGSTTILDEQSSFSNWGSCVDIYAPGSNIISSFPTSPTAFKTMSGTSMASPHVAGIAAAMRSANPSWNPTEIRNSIVDNAAALLFGGSLAIVDDVIDCSKQLTWTPTSKPGQTPTSKPTQKPTSPTRKPTRSPTKKPTMAKRH